MYSIHLCVQKSITSNLSFVGAGGVLPSKRLLGMCRWMGSHFHNWTDYNGVTFLVELLEFAHFRDFWDKKILVSGDLKIGRFAVKKWFLLLF